MCNQFITVGAFILPLLVGSPVAQSVELTEGAMLSNSCAACHGTDGNSPGAIPSIKAKSSTFIASSLKEFRDGKRPSTVMGRHAKGYSDKEIQLIANYFANLK